MQFELRAACTDNGHGHGNNCDDICVRDYHVCIRVVSLSGIGKKAGENTIVQEGNRERAYIGQSTPTQSAAVWQVRIGLAHHVVALCFHQEDPDQYRVLIGCLQYWQTEGGHGWLWRSGWGARARQGLRLSRA